MTPLPRRSYNFLQRMGRLIKFRLIIPILRSPHPPVYKARGVAVGLAWAMTPLVGIQMWLVFMMWVIAKRLKWEFSLVLGLAWTWVTNVFTLPPIYYVFYVTGQLMRGNWDEIGGYTSIKRIIENTFLSDLGFVDEWLLFFKLLLKDWGISMAIGCLPWALVFGVGSYYLTLKYEQLRASRRQKKQIAQQDRKNPKNVHAR